LGQLSSMVRELVEARELVWRLFYRDVRAQYGQTFLGVLWPIIVPVFTVAVFTLIHRAGILTMRNIDVPYALYSLTGLAFWSIFSVSLTATSGCLVQAGPMIVKINFPKVALVVSSSLQSVVDFFIKSLLIVMLCSYYRMFPPLWHVVLAGLAVLPIYLLSLGLGFVLCLAAGISRDILSVLPLTLNALMIFTPVFYPGEQGSLLYRLNVANPLNYLVNVPRDFLFQGRTAYCTEFAVAVLFSVSLLLFGWRLFYLAQPKIAERI